MKKDKDPELMNRFELINELEKLVKERDYYKKQAESLSFYQDENHKHVAELGRLYSQQTIIAQYFDALGQKPGMKMWLDVADDLRTGRLIGLTGFKRRSKRDVKDRREQPQGRRKKARRVRDVR